MIEDVIERERLRPLLALLGRWAVYEFDETDWHAVEHGLFQSAGPTEADAEETTLSYPLEGQERVDVQMTWYFADDAGVNVKISAGEFLEQRAAGAMEAMNAVGFGGG